MPHLLVDNQMFIGLIGTRYSGKTTVVEYLKTRGFTVLKLRSGDGMNDEDTSTAASSEANHRLGDIVRDGDVDNLSLNDANLATSSSVPAPSSRIIDLAGQSGIHTK